MGLAHDLTGKRMASKVDTAHPHPPVQDKSTTGAELHEILLPLLQEKPAEIYRDIARPHPTEIRGTRARQANAAISSQDSSYSKLQYSSVIQAGSHPPKSNENTNTYIVHKGLQRLTQ